MANITVYDPTYHVDAYVPEGSERQPQHIQAAVDAALAGHGGQVILPRGEFPVDNLTLDVDPVTTVITIVGQGVGHETSGSVLRAPDGGTGITIRSTNPQRAATVHLQNFEVHRGDYGITVERPGLFKNMRWHVACRRQTIRGIGIEADGFQNEYDVLIIPAYRTPEDPIKTVGFYVYGYQSRNRYKLEIRQAGAGFVSDVGITGAEGLSTISDGLFEGNLGPAIKFYNSREGQSPNPVTQFIAWTLRDLYFETNGVNDGSADILMLGHAGDLTMIGIQSSPPSPAQMAAPNGPLLLEITGYSRRDFLSGISGSGKSIRIAGRTRLAANHTSIRSTSTHLTVIDGDSGGLVMLDAATGKYMRLYVNNGQIQMEDVTEKVVG